MFNPKRGPLQHSILDLFRSGSGQPQQTPQQQQQGPQPKPTQTNANPNDPGQQQQQQVPDQQQQQSVNDKNKSPLDEFTKLWDNEPVKEGQQTEPDLNDWQTFVPAVNIDPKKLLESAKRIDFSKVMNPERVTAALKGDAAAFGEVINSVLQAAFANSAMSTSKISEAMQRRFSEQLFTKGLPHHIRKHTVNSTIDNDNPILRDPAVAPMMDMMKERLIAKYPKASAKEISDMAKKLITGFADVVKGGKGGKGQDTQQGAAGLDKTGDGNENWEEFFNIESKQ